MLIDTHTHFSFEELGKHGQKTLDIISNANKEFGVGAFIDISTQESEFKEIINFTNNTKNVFGSIGIHPCKVASNKHITTESLVKHSSNSKIIAIGECGLDYIKGSEETKQLQKEIFIRHLHACRQTNLPVIVHNRGADDDIYNTIKNFIKEHGNITGVVHCFSSNLEFANKMIDLGFYISFTGIVTFKNAQSIQETAKNIPLNKILVETDAPYLAPVPYRGKTNYPCYVKFVASHIANLRELSEQEFINATYSNFLTLFSKAKAFII